MAYPRFLVGCFLGLLLVVQVYPLVWIFLTSVRDDADFASHGAFGLPQSFTPVAETK